MLDQEAVVAEVRRDELRVRATRHELSLRSPVEAGPIVDVGVGEELVRAEHEPAADRQIRPVVSLRERTEQRHRRAGDDAKTEGVFRTYEPRRLVKAHFSRDHRIILPDSAGVQRFFDG